MNPSERFSEFTYGFATTAEFLQKIWPDPRIRPLPFFPNLRIEGLPGFGYDVSIPLPHRALPLCLQYKVPQIRKKSDPNVDLKPPFFKFEIKQHQNDLLLDLQGRGKALVYYCAPTFVSVGELNECYIDGDITRKSIRILPEENLNPTEKHFCYFDKKRESIVRSEERKLGTQPSLYSILQEDTERVSTVEHLKLMFSIVLEIEYLEKRYLERIRDTDNRLSDFASRWAIKDFHAQWRYHTIRELLLLNYGVYYFLVP